MARTILGLASILALASACATTSAPASGTAPVRSQAATGQTGGPAVASGDQKLVCSTERPVGSNIPKRICRTPEQIERERQAAQDKIRDIQTPGPKKAD
jgi:hypothetical protein